MQCRDTLMGQVLEQWILQQIDVEMDDVELVGVPADAFPHCLINEYRPGTPLGWHRDVPEFELVVGVSLAGRGRMRFRPYPPRKGARVFVLDLEPRSVYVLRDEIRWRWQHSVAPTPELRYSVTFRTRR